MSNNQFTQILNTVLPLFRVSVDIKEQGSSGLEDGRPLGVGLGREMFFFVNLK